MRRRLSLVLVAASLLGACNTIPPFAVPTSADIADRFLAAWNERDTARMIELLDARSRWAWSPRRLRSWLDLALSDGHIASFRAARTGDPDSDWSFTAALDPPDSARVPYSVTYDSKLFADPAVLEGELELVYEGEEGWAVSWDKAALWPGVERAARFDVTYRWPRRAAIRDRGGRIVAHGPARRRSYPFGSAGGSTVGHIGVVDAEEVQEFGEPYQVGALAGASGLEQALEERLAGEPGMRWTVDARNGKPVRTLAETDARRGRAVRATLDMRVQRAAEGAFGGTVGGAVVLEPSSGDILAAVSSSAFDPNNYVGADDVFPFNRALSARYPPGSAMKVVTAAAALDTGAVTPDTKLTGPAEYRGVRNFESGAFGVLDFATAVENSVNTAFAQVALELGAKTLTRYAEAFGFNRPPRMPLEAATSEFPFPEDEGDLMWGAIGQAQVLATPLEMATVAATVANGGRRAEPRATLDAPERVRRVVKPSTASVLTSLMERVVRSGTGTAANVSGVRVAGKTGTAEVDVAGERRNHAWFVAFAPADDPVVAVAVVAEYGGVGGRVAAPLARSILERVLPLLR